MQELGPATEHEMVLAFLQAEVESPRWRGYYAAALQHIGSTGAIIDRPDLTSADENDRRLRVLGLVRGYRANQYLFTGFPLDTTWRRVRLEPDDFPLLRYGNLGPGSFTALLSRGTRRVVDAAANLPHIETDQNHNIHAVAEAMRAGQHYPPLIAVESGADDLLLIEGYTRATAYALLGPTGPVEFLIGTSPRIRGWHFY